MASGQDDNTGLSYSYLIQLAEDEAFEDLMVREGYRVSDHGRAIEADQRKKARGFAALARMARHVSRREFGVFTKGGMK